MACAVELESSLLTLVVISGGRETEKHREKERLAAIAIQTNWRMLKVKWMFKKKVRACILISRVFRGHIARLRVDLTKQDRNRHNYYVPSRSNNFCC